MVPCSPLANLSVLTLNIFGVPEGIIIPIQSALILKTIFGDVRLLCNVTVTLPVLLSLLNGEDVKEVSSANKVSVA